MVCERTSPKNLGAEHAAGRSVPRREDVVSEEGSEVGNKDIGPPHLGGDV